MDGEDGPALDVASGGFDDIEDPNDDATGITEDVEFDPVVYDYVIPKAKNIDALRVVSNPDTGGIDVLRIPPAKYVWDQLWELHEYLEDAIPQHLRVWTGDTSIGPHLEVLDQMVEETEADLSSHPFVEDAGGALGTDDDSLTNPEFIRESDVVDRLVRRILKMRNG